ncbi:MAG: murein biosynthesis integral membrane protein MurJ [Alphaproteobacteria bacterium]|nr:MAG: murein biosynthesis integral membrane protein MurJ [Alphaproteobacteria bacterium]
MRLIRNAVSVGSFTAVSRLLGFVREWLQAHYIGASITTDALNFAISFPSFFRRIFAEGALNASFVPIFSSTLAGEGVEEARRFAESVLSLLAGFLAIFVLLMVLQAENIIPWILPGFKDQPERLELTVGFIRITFPFLLFISLTAFFSGMLNSVERFVAAASSPAVGNLVIIATLALSPDFGQDPASALAMGVLGCGVAQFLWVFIPSQRSGVRLRLKVPKLSPKVKMFFRRLMPAALGASVVQVNLIVDMMLSSYLPEKCFSFLKYADRFSQLPISIIGTAVSTALLPTLSRQLRKGEFDDAHKSQNRSIEFVLFFSLPIMIVFMFMAHEIIASFYVHGKFKVAYVDPTAKTLIAFVTGLPAYVLVKVLSTSFFSRGDTRTPVVLAVIAVLLNFCLNLILIQKYHQIGMATASAVSAFANALLLGGLLYRKGFLKADYKLKRFIPRIFLTTAALTGYMMWIHPVVMQGVQTMISAQWFVTLLSLSCAGLFYLGFAYLIGTYTLGRVQEHLSAAHK